MIKIIFELYATGEYGIGYISDYLYAKGFKTRKGGYIHTTTRVNNSLFLGIFYVQT